MWGFVLQAFKCYANDYFPCLMEKMMHVYMHDGYPCGWLGTREEGKILVFSIFEPVWHASLHPRTPRASAAVPLLPPGSQARESVLAC